MSLDQSKIAFNISNLLKILTLLSLISLNWPYNFKLVFEFYSNLLVSANHSCLWSFICSREVSLTLEDFFALLRFFISISFAFVRLVDLKLRLTPINLKLHGTALKYLETSTNYLVPNACAIQHIIMINVILKYNDRIYLTPLILIVTYFINSQT